MVRTCRRLVKQQAASPVAVCSSCSLDGPVGNRDLLLRQRDQAKSDVKDPSCRPLRNVERSERQLGRIPRGARRNLRIGVGFLRESPKRSDSRSEEHTSELQSLMRISYAVFCLKKNTSNRQTINVTVQNTH